MPLLQRVTGRREASAAAWEHIGDCPTKMYFEDDQDHYGDAMATAISHVALSKEATLDALSKPTDLSDELCPYVCDQPCG